PRTAIPCSLRRCKTSFPEIPFQGDVTRGRQIGDDIWVDPKPICESFGLDWFSQRTKLASSSEEGSWAVMVKITMTGNDGNNYQHNVISLETLLVWLPTISLNCVPEQDREKLRLYQNEAGKALLKTRFHPGRRNDITSAFRILVV